MKGPCHFCGTVGSLAREVRRIEHTVLPDGRVARTLVMYGHVVCRFCQRPRPGSFVDRRTVIKDRPAVDDETE